MDHRPPRTDQPYAWDDERLSAYLDGELSAPEQAQLEARLVVDPELRQLVDELRAVRQQLEILPEYHLKPTFADQVLRRAEQEMLLAPHGGEISAPCLSPTTLPTAMVSSMNHAAAAVPVSPVPRLSFGRRWRRGAIWTAVAAAAVLLLVVTNRPQTPEQDHVARNDGTETLEAKPSAAKISPADSASPAETSPELAQAGIGKTPNARQGIVRKEGKQDDRANRREAEVQLSPLQNAVPSTTTVVGDARGVQRDAAPTAPPQISAPAVPKPTEPKQGYYAAPGPELKQAAQGGGGNKIDANQQHEVPHELESVKERNAAAAGKLLQKSPNPVPRQANHEKQSAIRHDQLSPQLDALLASKEFSQWTGSIDGKHDSAVKEQLLVVYVTPRVEQSGERSFESLLANNSIELAERPLLTPEHAKNQRDFAALAPVLAPEGHDLELLVKGAEESKQDSGTRTRNATESGEARIAEHPSNDSISKAKSAGVPGNESTTDRVSLAANELYYLEAEASQVDELLRQLRESPDRFSRLNIAKRELPIAMDKAPANDAKFYAEKSGSSQAMASPAKAEHRDPDKMSAEGMALSGKLGDQQSDEQKQLAPGTAPTQPAGAALPSVPVSPATSGTPFAPAPSFSAEGAAPAASEPARAKDAAAALEGASLANAGRSNRRATQADKSLQNRASGDRAIAYRLRGVESHLPETKAEQAELTEGGRGGFGGEMPQDAPSSFATQPSSGAGMPLGAEKPIHATKPSAASGNKKATAGVNKLNAKEQDAKIVGSATAPQPAAESAAIAVPGISTQEKKMEQPRLQADSLDKPTQMPTPRVTPEQDSERAKVGPTVEQDSLDAPTAQKGATHSTAEPMNKPALAEQFNKGSPPAPAKRVRVLFVIEHAPRHE